MNITLDILSASKFRRALQNAPDIVVRETNRAIRMAFGILSRHVAPRVPVDTGNLRRGTILALTNPILGVLRGEAIINVDYASAVHEGTKFMRPRPFLVEGADAGARDLDNVFKEAGNRIVDQIAARS